MKTRVLDPGDTATPFHPGTGRVPSWLDRAIDYLTDIECDGDPDDPLRDPRLALHLTCDLKRVSHFNREKGIITLDLQSAFDACAFVDFYTRHRSWPRYFAGELFGIISGVAVSNCLIHLERYLRSLEQTALDSYIDRFDVLASEPVFCGLFSRGIRPWREDYSDLRHAIVSFLLFHEIGHFLQRGDGTTVHTSRANRETDADYHALDTLLELDKYFETAAFCFWADIALFGSLTSSFLGEYLPSFSSAERRKAIFDEIIRRVEASTYKIIVSYATQMSSMHRDLVERTGATSEGIREKYRAHARRFTPIYQALFSLLDLFFADILAKNSEILTPDTFDLEPALHFLYSPYLPSEKVHHAGFEAWEFIGGGLVDEQNPWWIMGMIRTGHREFWSRKKLARTIRRTGKRLTPRELKAYGYRRNLILGRRFIEALSETGRSNPIKACDEILYLNYDLVITKMSWSHARLGKYKQ